MQNIAIIDVGSNSIKLVLAEVRKNHSFKIIDELKETVRLGEGMSENSVLKEDRIKKALQTLKMFTNLCEATGTDYILAVATAAVREADNQKEFLNRVKKLTGLEIRVISGEEEGFLDYWGVVNSINGKDGLIMDIGGGSVELIWMENREVKENVSLPFGTLDITQLFNLYDSITDDQENDLEKYLLEKFQGIPWLQEFNIDRLIGVGGTIRNIAKIDQKNKNYPLDILHYYKMNNSEVQNVFNEVKSKNLEERKNISGLSKDRADIFIGASAIVFLFMNNYNINKLLISGKGIREGLIYKYLNDSKKPAINILDFSIRNIIQSFNLNYAHAEHIYHLTNIMYHQLKGLFNIHEGFMGDIQKIIKTASMLHDIGHDINYYDHHEHSFYIILNSGINGLTHRELLISAYIAASHRHTKYSLKKYNLNRKTFRQIISKNGLDKEVIRKTGILLEIAESLDRNMNGIVKDVFCEITEDSVIIETYASEDVELEINDALEAAEGFQKLYNKNLIIK